MPHSRSDHYPIMDEAFCLSVASESLAKALREIQEDLHTETSLEFVPDEQKMFVYLPRITRHVKSPIHTLKNFPFIPCERSVYMSLFFEDFKGPIRALYKKGRLDRRTLGPGDSIPSAYDEMRVFRKEKNLPDAVQMVRFPIDFRGMFVVVLNETSFSIDNTGSPHAYFEHYADCAKASEELYRLLVEWMSVVSANVSLLQMDSETRLRWIGRTKLARPAGKSTVPRKAIPPRITSKEKKDRTVPLNQDPRYEVARSVKGQFTMYKKKELEPLEPVDAGPPGTPPLARTRKTTKTNLSPSKQKTLYATMKRTTRDRSEIPEDGGTFIVKRQAPAGAA